MNVLPNQVCVSCDSNGGSCDGGRSLTNHSDDNHLTENSRQINNSTLSPDCTLYPNPASDYCSIFLQNGAPPVCDSPYLGVDWIEFFESCPDHYDIQAAMIAGSQEEYVASNYIKAGYIDRGNAIVTNNGRTSFKAMNYIELVPGFLSDYGSVLEVIPNSPCINCAPHKSLTINQPFPEVNEVNASRITTNPVGSTDEELVEGLQVIPNPAFDRCSIVLEQGLIYSIQIIDNKGQQIYLIEGINNRHYEINVLGLSAGMYYIVVKARSNDTFYKKLLKL